MGFVLSRQHYSVNSTLEGGRQKLSEYSGPEMVADCHRCYSRLGKLERNGDRWRVAPPADRIVSPFLGAPYLRCRTCSERIPVPLSRLAVRPFSVVIAGLYQSVLDRARPAVEDQLSGCAVVIRELLLSRSRCAAPSEDDLPAPPIELLLLVHKVSGARNPITDGAGLYTEWLEQAWPRCDVVAVLLLDVTAEYLSAMLEEQPTLRGLLALGRLIPVFAEPEKDQTPEKERTPEKEHTPEKEKTPEKSESSEAEEEGSGTDPTEVVLEEGEASSEEGVQRVKDGESSSAGSAHIAKEGEGSTEDGEEGTSEPAEATEEAKAADDGAEPEEAYWAPLLRKGLRGSVPVCASFTSARAKAGRRALATPCEAELRTWLDGQRKADLVCV